MSARALSTVIPTTAVPRPVARPGVAADAAAALAGNLVYAACQWGVLVALARLTTAADVGRFALALAVTAPVMILANLHLRVLQATDARGEHPFGAYLALRLLTSAGALLVIAAVALALGQRSSGLVVVLLVGLAKAAEAVSDLVFGLLQRAGRLRRVATSQVAKGVASVVAVALVLLAGGGVVGAAAALACAWAAVLFAVDLPAAAALADLRPRASATVLRRLALLALPMGCVMSLNSVTANVPRYAVEATLGSAALGHYAALAYLLVAAAQPVAALGAAASPRLARLWLDDAAGYRRLVLQAVAAAGALGVGVLTAAALGARPFLARVYAPEYAAHAGVLVVLAAAAAVGFVATALGVAVTAARRLVPQLGVAVAALAVVAAASTALVPRLGLAGAAAAVLAGEMTRLGALGVLCVGVCRAAEPGRNRPAAVALRPVTGDA